MSVSGQAGAAVWKQTNVFENHHHQTSLMVPVCREDGDQIHQSLIFTIDTIVLGNISQPVYPLQ